MGFVDDIGAAWAAEDNDAETDEAWRGHRQEKRAAQVAEAVADVGSEKISEEDARELAEMLVTWGDAGLKRIDPVYAQDEGETARLIDASTPVLQKYVPKSWTLGSIPPEWVLLGTVAMIYWPKFKAAKRAAAAAAEREASGEKQVDGTVTARKGMHAVP